MHRIIPIYSKFCGGFNIQQAKQLTIPFGKIYDFVREEDANKVKDTHIQNITGLLYTKNATHAIKISGIRSQYIDLNLKDYYHIAKEHNHQILIDAEGAEIQNYINDITDDLIVRYNIPEKPIFFKTYQMYRKDSLSILEKDIRDFGTKLGVKLVRGAYLEQDRQSGMLYDNKEETNVAYNTAINMLGPEDGIRTIVASHNYYSCIRAMRYFPQRFVYAQLFGMADNLGHYLLKKDEKVFKYIPYGMPHDSIPYLLRRLYENKGMLKYIV